MTPRAFQPDDTSLRFAGAGLAVMASLAVIGAGVAFALRSASEATLVRAPATAVERTRLVPQGARLEADPRADRLALEADARRRLESYGWTDRAKGLAHIPIARAMALQAEAGWPDAENSP